MKKRSNIPLLLFVVAVLLLVTLSCLPGGEPDVDEEGTQAALIAQEAINIEKTSMAQTQTAIEATQAALAAQPTEAPQPPPPPTEPPEPAGSDTTLTIYNESNATVCYLNITLSTDDSWGDDWLAADQVLPPGDWISFDLNEGTYDLRAQTCDFEDIEIVWDSFLSGPMEWTIVTVMGYDPGDVMFFDEFDFGDPNWSVFTIRDTDTGQVWNGGRYTSEFVGSKLYVVADTDYTYVYVIYEGEYYADPYANVIIDARVEKVGGPNRNNIALICRLSEDGWIEFAITSGGLWEAYRYDANAGYSLIGSGGSTAINLQFAVNDLTLECIDNTFTLYANGVYVGEVRDNRYREGFVGVSVSSFDLAGVEVEVDWFIVSYAGN
jgi:hypothetical protein